MQLETLATCFCGSFISVSLTVITVCDQLKVLQDATGYIQLTHLIISDHIRKESVCILKRSQK